jgi:hypothetical protein
LIHRGPAPLSANLFAMRQAPATAGDPPNAPSLSPDLRRTFRGFFKASINGEYMVNVLLLYGYGYQKWLIYSINGYSLVNV